MSPEVKGDKVIFRYKNSDADNVYIRGLNGWDISDEYKMVKDAETGIHTLEVELPHGGHQYKFYYKDSAGKEIWLADPSNDQVIGNDGNSYVFVTGSKEYAYKIHYYNPNVDVPTTTEGPDLHIWDVCEGG